MGRGHWPADVKLKAVQQHLQARRFIRSTHSAMSSPLIVLQTDPVTANHAMAVLLSPVSLRALKKSRAPNRFARPVCSSQARCPAHKDYGIMRSMSRGGTPTDTPAIEALNGRIKEELHQNFDLAHADNVSALLASMLPAATKNGLHLPRITKALFNTESNKAFDAFLGSTLLLICSSQKGCEAFVILIV